ncbi:hypothetical protein AAES_28297 [Amazona aestiva]|uniref:Uncharacterized protein n=1 Tax=Amazona aestiva TaxID=12930 RepID=A0A0Q3WDL4_AMAAE|nr:hypothetical protein AAES_28297 [Amazona aestiva]
MAEVSAYCIRLRRNVPNPDMHFDPDIENKILSVLLGSVKGKCAEIARKSVPTWRSPTEVIQTNTNLSGGKYIPNKPIDIIKKISKWSVEIVLYVIFLKGSAYAWNRVVLENDVETQFEFSSCCSITTTVMDDMESFYIAFKTCFQHGFLSQKRPDLYLEGEEVNEMIVDYEMDRGIKACYNCITRNYSCHMVVVKANEQKEGGDEGIKVALGKTRFLSTTVNSKCPFLRPMYLYRLLFHVSLVFVITLCNTHQMTEKQDKLKILANILLYSATDKKKKEKIAQMRL